jgi:FkbM family methyltransferase
MALSNISGGTTELFVGELLHGHGSIAEEGAFARHAASSSPATQRHSVNVTTLDRWWASLVHRIPRAAEVGISMLKIDTEGAELMVLLGGASFITSQSPEIFLEMSSHTEDFGYASSRITELLNSWGYVGKAQGDGNVHFIRLLFAKDAHPYGRSLVALAPCHLLSNFDDLPRVPFDSHNAGRRSNCQSMKPR